MDALITIKNQIQTNQIYTIQTLKKSVRTKIDKLWTIPILRI
jgi:hypothetical protein